MYFTFAISILRNIFLNFKFFFLHLCVSISHHPAPIFYSNATVHLHHLDFVVHYHRQQQHATIVSLLSTLTISSSHYHQRSGPPPKAFNRLICKMGLIILIASIFLCVIRRQSNVFMHASCSVKCLDDYCLAVLSVG